MAGWSGTHECTTARYHSVFFGSHEENMAHLREGEVAFKVDAGGRAGASKINCLNTTGEPIIQSLHLDKFYTDGAIVDFSPGAEFLRHLRDQSFV